MFHRSTRSVSLTEPGARFLAELQPAFGQIDRALDGLNLFRDSPFGTVRINVPNSIAPYLFQDVIGSLLASHPGLRLDIVASDRLDDIVAEGFDAGVRFRERLSPDVVAVRITPRLRFAVVGSPRYWQGRHPPQTPYQLREHACIRYRFPSGAIFSWQFERNGEAVEVDVDGPVTLDSQELMVEAALQGCGLAYVWDFRIIAHLRSGALIRCLDDWCAFDDSLFLYYSSRRHLSAGLRVLIDALKVAEETSYTPS